MNTGGAKIPVKVCSSADTIYSSSEGHPYNAVGVMPTVTTSELLISSGAVLLPSSQLKVSHLSHIITDKDLSVTSAPDGHSCCNCWRLLYPLALLVHSVALFCYLDGKDISALPLCKSRMEASRALVYCCCSPDWSSSISGRFLHRIWTVMAEDLIAIFLFHSISQSVAHRQAEPIHQNDTGETLFWC